MSTTLTPSPSSGARDAAAPAKAPGGLPWTVFRLHRWALWVWIAYVAVAAGLLLWAWGPAANELRSLLAGCDLGEGQAPACVEGLWQSLDAYDTALRYGFLMILGAPLLIAAWAGASLTGRELETGTAHLAWTQSVRPARWLAAKLALPAVAAAAGTALLLGLYRLAYLEGVGFRQEIRQVTPSWWNEDYFTAMGVVMVPRVLCAVAVGVLLGLLLKRTLPALGLGALLMFAATVKFAAGRDGLWPTEIAYGFDGQVPSPYFNVVGNDKWPVASGAVTESGDLGGYDYACLDSAFRDSGPTADLDAFYACLKADGLKDVWATYHPKDHFWPLQLVESGIWLGAAALAVLLSYRLLRRRTA